MCKDFSRLTKFSWASVQIARQVVYIEAAVHGLPGTELIAPAKLDSSAQLRTVDLVVIDHDVQALIVDLEVLIGLVKVNCVIICVIM